ncbi:MAG: QueT transporter family protein [Lachnospiraceae bacterium]|nr:QueT transporter family protein [Lachnospiraceae bacterium]
MQNKKVLFISQAAAIAALYVVLTLFIASFNLANGAIQIRISEALTILPVFTAAAVPGVAIGCFLSNILTGCALPDIIFGTLATLIGALGTRYLKNTKFMFTLPPVLSNALIIPFILKYAYGLEDMLPFLMLTVGIGEIISIMGLGMVLYHSLKPISGKLFN